jgi:hypothetical protein
MSAAALTTTGAASSLRLLADVKALAEADRDVRLPAQMRLEAVIGRDFADRLLAALSTDLPADLRD